MELCVARNLVLHLLYSFINKGVAKEECGNIGPACLLQYLTSTFIVRNKDLNLGVLQQLIINN